MRHRSASKSFNRDTNHRKMMIRNLVRSLVEHGEIVTTEAKAKETKRWADRLISKAQNDTISVRRRLQSFFGQRNVANTLVEKIAPAMKKRVGGFTSITKLGSRRGDNTELVKLSLLEQREERHTLKSKVERPKVKRKPAPKKTKALSKKVTKAAAKKAEKTKKAALINKPALAQKAGPKFSEKPTRAMPIAQRVQRRTTAKGK